jgi:hypothetical protein
LASPLVELALVASPVSLLATEIHLSAFSAIGYVMDRKNAAMRAPPAPLIMNAVYHLSRNLPLYEDNRLLAITVYKSRAEAARIAWVRFRVPSKDMTKKQILIRVFCNR